MTYPIIGEIQDSWVRSTTLANRASFSVLSIAGSDSVIVTMAGLYSLIQ